MIRPGDDFTDVTDVDKEHETAIKYRNLALKVIEKQMEQWTGNRSWMPLKTMVKEVPLKCRRDSCHNRTLCMYCQKHWRKVLDKF